MNNETITQKIARLAQGGKVTTPKKPSTRKPRKSTLGDLLGNKADRFSIVGKK